MKKILLLLILSIINIVAKGQYYFPVTHSSGSQTTGCTNVTVTSAGQVGTSSCSAVVAGYSMSFPGATCNSGSYTWSFTPGVNSIHTNIVFMDRGEEISVFVNGMHVNFLFYGTYASYIDPDCYAYSPDYQV